MMIKIYAIENTHNHKLYIGLTRNSIQKRFEKHVASANSGVNYALKKAIRKYGVKKFDLFVLAEVFSEDKAFQREKEYIRWFDTCHGIGYNETEGGEGVSGMGGERASNSKLSNKLVYELRVEYMQNDGLSTYKIADRLPFEIEQASVSDFLSGKTYTNVPIPEGYEEKISEQSPFLFGENVHNTSFTEKEVLNIRKLRAEGVSPKKLANRYSVTTSCICTITSGESWTHVGGPITKKSELTEEEIFQIRVQCVNTERNHEDIGREYGVTKSMVGKIARGDVHADAPGPIIASSRPQKLTDEDVGEIRKRYKEGSVSYTDLGEEFGVSRQTIGGIIRGEERTDL